MEKLEMALQTARANYAQACKELREAFTVYHKALNHYETTGKPANEHEYDFADSLRQAKKN
jgi:hypothetical protein